MKKFGFYVSGNATRLYKTIDIHPEILYSTSIIVNDDGPNEKLSEKLKNFHLEYIEFNYKDKSLKGKERNNFISELLFEKLNEHNIDYCFCFGSKILNEKLLINYKNRIINFHPSVLPMFPGEKSIDKALNSNSFLIGNTAHFIDNGVDTGPVILQCIIHNSNFNNYDFVLDQQINMMKQIFVWLNEDRINVENNKVIVNNADYSKITFYPKLEN